eukprot:427685_1
MQQLYQQLQNQQTVRQVTAPNQAVYYQQMQPQPILDVNSQHIRQPQSIQYSIPQSQTLQTQIPNVLQTGTIRSYVPQQISYQAPQINTNTGVSTTPLVTNNGFVQGVFNSSSQMTLPNSSSTPIYTLPAATTMATTQIPNAQTQTQTQTFAQQNGCFRIISQPHVQPASTTVSYTTTSNTQQKPIISAHAATVAPSQAQVATNIHPTQPTRMIISTNTPVANNSCQKQQQFQQLQQQQQATQQQLSALQSTLQQLASLQQQQTVRPQPQNQTQTQIPGGAIYNNRNESTKLTNITPQQLALLAQQHFEQQQTQQSKVNPSGSIETHSNTTNSSQQNPPNKTHSSETNSMNEERRCHLGQLPGIWLLYKQQIHHKNKFHYQYKLDDGNFKNVEIQHLESKHPTCINMDEWLDFQGFNTFWMEAGMDALGIPKGEGERDRYICWGALRRLEEFVLKRNKMIRNQHQNDIVEKDDIVQDDKNKSSHFKKMKRRKRRKKKSTRSRNKSKKRYRDEFSDSDSSSSGQEEQIESDAAMDDVNYSEDENTFEDAQNELQRYINKVNKDYKPMERPPINATTWKLRCLKNDKEEYGKHYRQITDGWDEGRSPSKDWWYKRYGNSGHKLIYRDEEKIKQIERLQPPPPKRRRINGHKNNKNINNKKNEDVIMKDVKNIQKNENIKNNNVSNDKHNENIKNNNANNDEHN